mgnify:CR=1 FL=1
MDVWIIAGVLLVGGAVAALAIALRRKPEVAPALVEVDEVVVLKERVQLLLTLEEDLIAAGQALGRVRRFLVDPDEAGPVVDELRERLTDLWLRRFDYEGRLRLAALRRRLPAPPAIESYDDHLTADALEERSVELQALSNQFRDVARRAEDSARMFRRLAPAEDDHARWVGDAVEVAREWRLAQTEEIQRFAARVNARADRVEELSAQIGESLTQALLDAGAGAAREELVVHIPGLRDRIHGMARVGLAEQKTRELVPGTADEIEAEHALARARHTVADVRSLARKAGGTRSTRTPLIAEVPAVEASESAG